MPSDDIDRFDIFRQLPGPLQAMLSDSLWEQVSIGQSGHHVYRVQRPDGQACYLKIAPQAESGELAAEFERLRWLNGRLPVADAWVLSRSHGWAYLVQSEVPGLMACDAAFATDVPALARLLAEGLRHVHAVSIGGCPFDQRLERKIAVARERARAGLVDESDFDAVRAGMCAQDLLDVLIRNRPADEDVVFTHGDYCLPNVLIDPVAGHVSGYIDVARAGVADRYQDLALAVRSLAYNFGPGWEPYFWEAYGLDQPDFARVEFYQLLDEFF